MKEGKHGVREGGRAERVEMKEGEACKWRAWSEGGSEGGREGGQGGEK